VSKTKPRRKKKGWCSRCGGVWCDVHDCCPMDCADKHKEKL